MSQELHNELRKEFQLERMILFSDAVFAIAITLLIIEIKIPDIHEGVSDKVLLSELGHLIPKFIGFLVSFMLIGLYWTIHHRMFGYVTSFSKKLITLNLIFLFFIVLMPFSTGFYSEYAGKDLYAKQLKVPLIFYVMNFCLAGFMTYFLWKCISNPKNKLAVPAIDSLVIRLAKLRSLIVPAVFLSMIPVAYFLNVLVAVYMPLFIPISMRIGKRIVMKKHGKMVVKKS